MSQSGEHTSGDERWPVLTWVGFAAIVALVAVLSALAVRHACHPPAPAERAEPGTSQAGYCDAVVRGVPWLQALVSVVAFGAAVVTTRGRLRPGVGAAGVIGLANILMFGLAGLLPGTHPA